MYRPYSPVETGCIDTVVAGRTGMEAESSTSC